MWELEVRSETVAEIQVRHEDKPDQGISSGDGEKWLQLESQRWSGKKIMHAPFLRGYSDLMEEVQAQQPGDMS